MKRSDLPTSPPQIGHGPFQPFPRAFTPAPKRCRYSSNMVLIAICPYPSVFLFCYLLILFIFYQNGQMDRYVCRFIYVMRTGGRATHGRVYTYLSVCTFVILLQHITDKDQRTFPDRFRFFLASSSVRRCAILSFHSGLGSMPRRHVPLLRTTSMSFLFRSCANALAEMLYRLSLFSAYQMQ